MKPKHFNELIIALSIHIFSVHCKLLYYLNPEISTMQAFSYLNFDEPTILAMVFALSYSVATAFVIYTSNRKGLIITYGLIDTIGILLYYFISIPIHFGAIYFALYTGILIISTMQSGMRFCENCHQAMPETTRIDAIFCSPRCGWRHRNKLKREKRAEDIKNQFMDPIEKNSGIINFLYQNNSNVFSRQTLREIGFDPDACSGIRDFCWENHRTEIMIRD